jgi:RNA polymerase-interacting CarD/CdnL/TRCF family regulator
MFYAIAIAALMFLAYWTWGMRKMVRMNADPLQQHLAHLLIKAGNGKDEELLALIGEHRWNQLQTADHVSHALTLAEKLFPSDESSRAREYARTLRSRHHLSQKHIHSETYRQRTQDHLYEPGASTHTQNVSPSTNHPSQNYPASIKPIDNSARAEAPKQPIQQRFGFRVNEFVVYPAHGVGQILAIEEQEIAGAKLELFVINFVKDKMTLRVPARKIANVGCVK